MDGYSIGKEDYKRKVDERRKKQKEMI